MTAAFNRTTATRTDRLGFLHRQRDCARRKACDGDAPGEPRENGDAMPVAWLGDRAREGSRGVLGPRVGEVSCAEGRHVLGRDCELGTCGGRDALHTGEHLD
jgi:hypothetical protein